MIKQCSICKNKKPIIEYWLHKKSKDGLQAHCKDCHRKMGNRCYLKKRNSDIENWRKKQREAMKKWRKNNPQRNKEIYKKCFESKKIIYYHRKKIKHLEDKKNIIKNYGGKCACCGETDFRFLSVDHINNDGKKDRKRNIYKILKDKNYPNDIQILCFNCNFGRQLYGGINKICPHKILN